MQTVLKDRVLWFDGDSTIEPEVLADIVLRGLRIKKGVCVAKVTDEVERFNKLSDYQLEEKTENRPFSFDWNIPEKYRNVNLRTYLLAKLYKEVEANSKLTDADVEERIKRVDDELELYYEKNIHMLLRTTLFIIDTFRERNVVWGVGRGSACSSYILYLVGVHAIDSVYYDLEISDFLR